MPSSDYTLMAEPPAGQADTRLLAAAPPPSLPQPILSNPSLSSPSTPRLDNPFFCWVFQVWALWKKSLWVLRQSLILSLTFIVFPALLVLILLRRVQPRPQPLRLLLQPDLSRPVLHHRVSVRHVGRVPPAVGCLRPLHFPHLRTPERRDRGHHTTHPRRHCPRPIRRPRLRHPLRPPAGLDTEGGQSGPGDHLQRPIRPQEEHSTPSSGATPCGATTPPPMPSGAHWPYSSP